MENKFKSSFDNVLSHGDYIDAEVDGFDIRARIEIDTDVQSPWEDEDGHGPVSEWVARKKRPYERLLIKDGNSARYYDYADAIRIAKKENWDAPPYGEGTKAEQARRAVDRDFEVTKAWFNNEWHWCSVILSISKNGLLLSNHAASMGGVAMNHPSDDGESGADVTAVANELLDDAVQVGHEIIQKITEDKMKPEMKIAYDRYKRKAKQAWDMAGYARADGDTQDEQHQTNEARRYEKLAADLLKDAKAAEPKHVYDFEGMLQYEANRELVAALAKALLPMRQSNMASDRIRVHDIAAGVQQTYRLCKMMGDHPSGGGKTLQQLRDYVDPNPIEQALKSLLFDAVDRGFIEAEFLMIVHIVMCDLQLQYLLGDDEA